MSETADPIDSQPGIPTPEQLSDVAGPPLGLADLPVVRALALGLVAAQVDPAQAARDLAEQTTELALRRARRELNERPGRCPAETDRARSLLGTAIALQRRRADAASRAGDGMHAGPDPAVSPRHPAGKGRLSAIS